MDRSPQAEALLKHAVELGGKTSVGRDAQVRLAIFYQGDCRVDEKAIPIFEDYLNGNPKGPMLRRAQFGLALLYLKKDEVAKSEKLLVLLKASGTPESGYTQFLTVKIAEAKTTKK